MQWNLMPILKISPWIDLQVQVANLFNAVKLKKKIKIKILHKIGRSLD